METDISIEGQGIFTIQGQTDAGWDWIAENVNDAEDGVAHSDDQNYTQEIAEGATADGFAVAVNGCPYVAGGARGGVISPDDGQDS